jgi:hypothetical protein
MSHAANAGSTESARAIPAEDPVLAAMRRAPVGPPMTEQERQAMEEAREIGRWVPGDDVHTEIARQCRTGK